MPFTLTKIFITDMTNMAVNEMDIDITMNHVSLSRLQEHRKVYQPFASDG